MSEEKSIANYFSSFPIESVTLNQFGDSVCTLQSMKIGNELSAMGQEENEIINDNFKCRIL